MRTFQLLALLVVLGCGAAASAQDAFPIKIDRPTAAGSKYEVSGTSSIDHSQRILANGQVAQEEASSGSLEVSGLVEILEVAADGRVVKARLVIEECLFTSAPGAEAVEALPAGTKITGSLVDDASVLTAEGAVAIPEEIKEMLDDFCPVQKQKGHLSDDAIFGTTELKKVGNQWPLNSELAAKSLGEAMETTIEAKNFQGSVLLKSKSAIDEVDCLEIVAEAAITHVAPPMPPGFTVEKGDITMAMAGHFPLDLAKKELRKSHQFTMDVHASGKGEQGEKLEIFVVQKRSVELELTPVP